MMDDGDAIDPARVARHERLLQIWRDVSAEEILADVGIAVQLAAFKLRQLDSPRPCAVCGWRDLAEYNAHPDRAPGKDGA